MITGRITGTVVATVKDPSMEGVPLLTVKLMEKGRETVGERRGNRRKKLRAGGKEKAAYAQRDSAYSRRGAMLYNFFLLLCAREHGNFVVEQLHGAQ